MKSTERTVILNSRFRSYNQDTSTNFNILLNKGIAVDDVDRIIVKRVSLPNLFYNVPERKKTLYIENEGNQLQLDMVPGQYDIDQFRASLETLLKTVHSNATVTVNYDTGKLTLSYFLEVTLGWTVLSHTKVKELYGVDESLNDIIGTSYDNQLASSLNWTSPQLIDLSGEHTVRIESSTLAFGNAFDSRGQILNTVDVVPVHEPFGSVVHYQPSDHIHSFVDSANTGRTINTVDIQLVANSGQQLQLPDNAYIEIVLLVIFRHSEY